MPPETIPERIRDDVDDLARRHGLASTASERLCELVGLFNWSRANFVPRVAAGRGAPKGRGVRATSGQTALALLAEALAGLQLEPLRRARWVADLGSGGGFPGLVLAIALPDARFTLVERDPERCEFLRHAIGELGLDHAEVVEGDVTAWEEGAGTCDVVTSRKLGRLPTVLRWSVPLLAPGGAVAFWPGNTDIPTEDAAEADEVAAANGLARARALPLRSISRNGRPVTKHIHVYERVAESAPAARSASAAEPIIAFVQIPGTADEPVTAFLADAVAPAAVGKAGNYLADPEGAQRKLAKRVRRGWRRWQREGGRVVAGPTPYTVLREGMPEDTHFITVLRDPIERVVANYRRDAPGAGSLAEALERRLPALGNLATRLLCDDPSATELPPGALDEAKANLRRFAFVGIRERLGDSIALLDRSLGLGPGPSGDAPDAPPPARKATDADRALVAEHNRLDVELYAFAVELFEEASRLPFRR